MPAVEPDPAAPPGATRCLLHLKVVPGARQTRLAGLLGDRVKVQVAAPPEDGRANRAVCELLAGALGVRADAVTLTAGPASPRKTVRVSGLSAAEVTARLGL